MSIQFKKSKIASYVCLALASGSILAAEESKKADDIEVIEVTGLRSSLTGEIAAKRSSEAISDSIIAEEIGKSSDENIAEAISRIAGISLDGDGNTITVRGIEASLNDIKLNGVSMTSSEDSQAVDLSLFSADMLSRIDVVKSPSANQEEGSLGASINLQTRAPLSSKNSVHIVTAETRYNDLSEENTPRFSYTFLQNYSDNLGFSGSLFHDKQIIRKEEASSNTYKLVNFYDDSDDTVTKPFGGQKARIFDYDTREEIGGSITALSSSGLLNRITIEEKIKKGGTFTVQYQPSENTDIRLDTTFSRQEISKEQSQMRINNFDRGGRSSREIYVRRNGTDVNTVYEAHTDLVGGQIQPSEYDSTIDNLVIGLNIEQYIGENWTIKGRLGYSDTQQDYENSHKANWTAFNPVGENEAWCSYKFVNGPEGDFMPEMNMCPRFDVSAPESIRLTQFRTNVRNVDDTKTSAYIDVQREFDGFFITSVEFGAKYTERNKFVLAEEMNLNSEFFAERLFSPSDITDRNITDGRFLDGIAPAGAPKSWIYPDMQETIDRIFTDGIPYDSFESDPSKASDLNEVTSGAYAQVNFEFFDGEVRGNFGVRYAKTEIETDSNSSIRFDGGIDYVQAFMALEENGGNANQTLYKFPVHGEREYDNWLPSATITWGITDDIVLRAAAARVMARPKIEDTRPSYAIRADSDERAPTGKGGNSNLEPYLADQYDMALEWYFEEGALLSANVFYKDYSTFNYKTEVDTLFAGEDFPLTGQPGAPDCLVDQSLITDDNPFPCAQVRYKSAVNGGEADIKGVELSYQQHYDFLPGLLKHLGTSINYTYADSEALAVADDLSSPFNYLPFPNTSKHSANIRAYWENDWSSYRLAYSYRGRSISTVVNEGSTLVKEAKGTLDFSANWTINENLKLTFAATNLTNSYDKTLSLLTDPGNPDNYSGTFKETSADLEDLSDDRVKSISSAGRNYRLFLRYKF